jgi:hypothetical protein
MLSNLVDDWVGWISGSPTFQIYGKARRELHWRVIRIYATPRRNRDSLWPPPFWRGTCITWTHVAIGIGIDFAEMVLREQRASRHHAGILLKLPVADFVIRPAVLPPARLRGRRSAKCWLTNAGTPGMPSGLALHTGPLARHSLSSKKAAAVGITSKTKRANRGYSAASSTVPSLLT